MSSLFVKDESLIPTGILYKSTDDIEHKIAHFQRAGLDQLQLVLDFDRTLTVGKSKNRHDSTSWDILRSHLPVEGQERAEEIKQYYRAFEIAGTMTSQQAVDWWSASINLMVEYGLDMAAVERDFLDKSTIRPGTKELFELCAEYDIPTIIMSAGVREVIEIWCKVYNIHPTIILSTDLELDQNSKIIGWKKETLVHTLNKQEIGHPELLRIRSERSHSIVVGDSLHDHTMAEGTDTALRIRILDPYESDLDQEAERTKSYELFDGTIEDGSLASLCDLIQTIKK